MHDQQENQKTILLVEDEAVIAMIEEQTLKRHGFNVIVASSGEKAINIVKYTKDIDLILMDINLGKGKMDGTEAAEIILKDNDIPVLFLSSYTQAEVVQKTEQITSYGYVVKDSGETVLITSIKMAFKLFDAHQRLKKREEALKESEKNYRQLVDTLQEGIWLIDKDSNTSFVNPHMAEMLGYTVEEMLGKPIFGFMDERGVEIAKIGIDRGKQNMTEQIDFELIRKDGNRIYTTLTATPMTDEKGNYVGSLAGVNDVTERKRAEDARRESEEALRAIVETAKDSIFTKDAALRYISVNPAMVELFGVPEQELIGKSDTELFGAAAGEHVEQIDRKVLTGEMVEEYPDKPVHGIMRHFHTIKVPLRDARGLVTGICGIARDITQHKQDEVALKESEKKFRLAFENAKDAIIWADSETGVIMDCNAAATELFEKPRGELVRSHQGTLHPPELLEYYRNMFADQTRDLRSGVEAQIVTSTGVIRTVTINVSNTEFEGRKIIQGVFRDISDRKQAEDLLRERAERFDQLAKQSGIITWEVDVRGLYTYISHVSEAVLGYRPDEMVGRMHFYDLHPESGLEAFKKAAFEVFDRKESFVNLENAAHTRDGRHVWLSTNGIPLLNTDGTLRGYQGSDTDITERKRAEEVLRESEAKKREQNVLRLVNAYHRSLIEVSQDPQMAIAPDGRITDVNKATEDATGYPRQKLIGTDFSTYFTVPAIAQEGYQRAFYDGHVRDLELELCHISGSVTPVIYNASVYNDETGEVIGVFATARDITERKRAEDALRESEARFRLLFNSGKDYVAVHLVGKDGLPMNFVQVNDAACENLGYTREELLNLSPQDIDASDSSGRIPELIEKLRKDKQVLFETEMICKNGHRIPMEVSVNLFQLDDNQATMCVARDITERKRAEEEIKQQSSLISSLLDSIPDIIFFKDMNGVYMGCNPPFAEFVGKPREAIIGRTDYDLFDKEIADFFREQDKLMLELRIPRHNEEWITYPDSRKVLIDTLKTPYWGADGKLIGVLGISRDITDRQQAVEALQQVTNRLSLAARAGGVGIWDYDVVSNHLNWDDQMFHLYGITPDQFGGAYEAWKLGLHPDDLQRGDIEIQMALRGEKEFDTEFRVVWPDGTIRNIRAVAIVQRSASGQPTHMIGTNWDITASKKAEEQLLLAREVAEAANMAKSSFLANMSHEIRTPMSGVIGMTGLLLETTLTDRQRDYAERIKTSGESLLLILNDILDFSKIEARKLTLESIPFSVEDVIGNVVNIFGPQVEEKGIELRTAIDSKLPAALLGDPQRLTQVISNLTGNAVKFTEAGDIRLAVRVLRQTAADVDLKISVQDTGIGITEEELARLFTAFSQVDASTTRRFGGSGLGLAISRQLVELMGGTIGVESTPGKGSVFTVVLPFPVASGFRWTDLLLRNGMPRLCFTGVRALVAEDHVINREIIVELLRQLGIESDIAVNGREAVEMVRVQDYDIVFMDIQMPEMDGFTATREIRKLGREGIDRLPILAMTAHALTGDREKSLDAGMNDHLTKPVDREALSAALRQWLPREKCSVITADLEAVMKPNLMSIMSTPALDVEAGIKRLGGNRDLYLKLLGDFVAGYRETPAQLLQELRTDRGEEVVRLVHAIRGVAGNIGGKELEAAAAELEKACRVAGNGVPFALGEPLRLFIDRHGELFAAIGAILARQPAVSPVKQEGTPGTAAEMRSLLKRLRKALASEEPRPCKGVLGELQQRQWPESHEVVLAELNRLVQSYRLTEALALLDKEFDDIIE